MGDCLGDSTIAAYVDGELDRDAIARVDRHIDGCESCRGQLSAVAVAPVLRSFVATATLSESRAPTVVAAGSYPGTAARGADPEPGSALGRYVVDAVIGRGGMGVVVRAYDPELDRRIAIKLVDPAVGASGAWRAGLRAEAQAMARLRHPNVVAVHDTGSVGDRLFVAMELVDGASLAAWRIDRDRDAALAACVAAGRGLCAAHAAGVVHGDVKPDNILVDRDGRAMIADFGLARAIASTGAGAGERRLCGTPAYMAPELYDGAPADVRSDQFAFAVTVYECVVGARPWRGDSLDALRTAIAAGPPPRPAGLPPTLWATIARGFATVPAARYPSLAAFVDALAAHAGASRRRRTWIAAGAAAMVAGGVAVAVASSASPGVACADPDVRTAALARIPDTLCAATGPSFCGRLSRGLGGWLTTWRATHRGVCRAAREGLDRATVDARMRCLDRGLRDFEALVAKLEPRPLVSADALSGLTAYAGVIGPDRCATAETARYPAPPADRAVAIADAEKVLAAANVDYAFGRFAAGLAALESRAAAVAELPYPPLSARFDLLLADLQREAGKLDAAEASYDRSLRAAARAGDDVTSATVLLNLAHLVAVKRQDGARATELVRAASAAIIRAGSPPELEARYLLQRGVLAEQRGDFAAAAVDYASALERRQAIGDPAEIAAARLRLCAAEVPLGKLDDARAHCTETLTVLGEQLGADHPLTAEAENQLAIVYASEGDLVKAREHWLAARAAFEKAIGPTAPDVASMSINLAQIASALGKPEEAKQHLDRAVAIASANPDDTHSLVIQAQIAMQHRAAGRPEEAIAVLEELSRRAVAQLGDHALTGDVQRELAASYYEANRMRDALPAYERALATQRAVFGDRHMVPLTTEGQYGQALMALGDYRAACAVLEKVMFVMADTVPADSPFLAHANTNLANCVVEIGEAGRAADLAEKALAIHEARGDDPVQRAATRFVLGQALWRSKRDRPRAVALVKQAVEEMRALPREPVTLEPAERWLAGKR